MKVCVNGQCDIKTNAREDGVTVTYISPQMVGFDDDVLLMIGLQTNGVDYFVNTAVMYKERPVKASGFLTIRFANNKSLKLRYVNSGIAKISGYNACSAIFAISKNQISSIFSSPLSSVIYHESADVSRVIKIQKNNSVLIEQFNCLSK